jgi:hypothetical protein
MVASAIALGIAGLAVSFVPVEFLGLLGVAVAEPMPVLMNLMGGLYLGLALVNWMAKDNMIGGIYSRPVAMGNFLHFFVGALSLAKHQLSGDVSAILVGALVVYGIFAGLFGWLVFGHGAACAAGGNPQSPDA